MHDPDETVAERHRTKVVEAGYTWPLEADGSEPEHDQVHPLAEMDREED